MMEPRVEQETTAEARRRRRGAVSTLALALAVLGAPVARAEGDGAPRFGEVIEVPLVELELLAVDRQGRPIDDLRREELTVFEDEARVEPQSFERVGPRAAPAATPGSAAAGGSESATSGAGSGDASGAGVEGGRSIAVFLDEVHVGLAGRDRLLGELAAALTKRLDPDDRVLVAFYDGVTRIVLPFTRDREALRATLEGSPAVSAARLLVDQERREAWEMIHRDASGEAGTSPCLHTQAMVDRVQEQEFHRVDLAIRALTSFVESLSGIAGRKAVLHLSEGIPLFPGAEFSQYAQEMCSGVGRAQGQSGAQGPPAAPDVYDFERRTQEENRFDTTRRWQEIAARANAGNVTLYTFKADPGPQRFGTTADRRVSGPLAATQAAAAANVEGSLFLIAEETGGRAFLGGGDPGKAISTALRELAGQYLLTYTPPPRADDQLRRIRVEVARPGVELRHRTLYRPRSLETQIGSQLVGRLLYSEAEAVTANGTRLALDGVVGREEDRVRARFRLEIPLAALALLEEEGSRSGSFAAYVAFGGEEGGTSSVRRVVVPVRVGPAGAGAPESFTWELDIKLVPGNRRVGVAIHDEVAGTIDFVLAAVAIPPG